MGYGTNYIETLRAQIHANCRIRRIYFSDRLYSEEELPPEFKLFLPIQVHGCSDLRPAAHPPGRKLRSKLAKWCVLDTVLEKCIASRTVVVSSGPLFLTTGCESMAPNSTHIVFSHFGILV